MVSKIRILNDDLINKIAAGEVIENPASVVKELVENSLDAGSTEICIEIKGGGRQLIRITDDGCGMNKDDALLCFERHATSKLQGIEDIHSLETMGFRGEAIPSIASISKFTLLTRPNEKNEGLASLGTMIMVDGGKMLQCSPVECAFGTTMEVKSLFFNVPVRKKFQKSPAYDVSEIHRAVTLLALANPHITFQLISNHESLLSTIGYKKENFIDALECRIQAILGHDFTQNLTPLKVKKNEYSLQGFISKPGYTKHNRTGQYLFLNRRAVASPLINFAIRDGYGTMLATGKHPLYVLHFDIPGGLIDVNVHPQKREVRLRQEHILRELIINSVSIALQNEGFSETPAYEVYSSPVSMEEIPATTPIQPAPSIQSHVQELPHAGAPLKPSEKSFDHFFISSEKSYAKLVIPTPPVEQVPPPLLQNQTLDLFDKSTKKNQFKVLGSIRKYIIAIPLQQDAADQETSVCFIDQRAAHARIIYERLLNDHVQAIESQSLLIPHLLDVLPEQTELIRKNLPFLQTIGIQIKEFGQNSFAIDALPQIFGNVDIQELIDQILSNLHDFNSLHFLENEKRKKIALSASRTAVSSERRLDIAESEALVNQLMRCRFPHQCPNGKPIIAFLSPHEIAKLF